MTPCQAGCATWSGGTLRVARSMRAFGLSSAPAVLHQWRTGGEQRRDSAEPRGEPGCRWPKVDLHRHLPGAIRFDTAENHQRSTLVPATIHAAACLNDSERTVDPGSGSSIFDLIDLFRRCRAVGRITCGPLRMRQQGTSYLELRFSPAVWQAPIFLWKRSRTPSSWGGGGPRQICRPRWTIAGLSRSWAWKCGDDDESDRHLCWPRHRWDRPAQQRGTLQRKTMRPSSGQSPRMAGWHQCTREAAGAEREAAVLRRARPRIGHGVRAERPAVLALLAERA